MLVGVQAGSFTLENVLGAGGFGAVYYTRGEQGQSLAVKVLFPPRSQERADIADYTSRLGHFQREIQFAASFHHSNIMRIHFSGSLFWHYDDSSGNQPGSYRSGDYNLPYYVTDYLPDSVEQRLQNGGGFSPAEAVEIGKQVCEALESLHGADPSILHLDLNPSNIRLAEGGHAVITDFGLVQVEGIPLGQVTREAAWIPPYVAAPEQRAGEELEIRTDIYQVGALLFLMLTGKSRREFAILTLLDQPSVPKSLARVVERCTRNDKEMRFQNVTGVKEALAAVKPSGLWEFIQMLWRRTAEFLSSIDNTLGARVPPLWRKPVAWLLVAFSAFAIAWVMGWVLPEDPVTITIASSSTKKEWMEQAVKDFNEASPADADLQLDGNPFRLKDRPIIVDILLEEIQPGVWDHYRSGSMIDDILGQGKVKIKPTIASPAAQFWIQKLREEWPGAKPIASEEGTGLLRTPLVMAMWRSRAEALGCWPTAGPDCTWETLVDLAASPDGWGMFGRPEWGKLKYGYGFVGKSNSATFTEVLICMSGQEMLGGITLDDVGVDTPCGEGMAALEEAEIRIFQKSEWALVAMRVSDSATRMSENGPAFLDAVTTYEQEVIELNLNYGPILPEPIVAVYPQDGTIVPTHPFAILDGAPSVTPEQANAATVFLRFLLSDQQQSNLQSDGLRPANPDTVLEDPINHSNGADPQAITVMVEVPDARVIKAIVALWECIRQEDCPR